MNTKNPAETARQMDKQALTLYAVLAAVIYLLALSYCYFTSHLLEMGIVGGVMFVLGLIIYNVYGSIKATPQTSESENRLKDAA